MALARTADELGAGNGALAHLTEGALTSLSENRPAARYIKAHFGTVRDALLRRHDWNFASDFEVLSLDPAATAGQFSLTYPLPSDCITVRDLVGANEDDWSVESRTKVVSGETVTVNVLSTDIVSPRIRFTRLIDKVSAWDPLFLEIFQLKLAAMIAPLLSRGNATELDARAEAKMPASRKIDQREAARSRIAATPSYVSVRRA